MGNEVINENNNAPKSKKKILIIALSIIMLIVAYALGTFTGLKLQKNDKCTEDNSEVMIDNTATTDETEKYTFENFKPDTIVAQPVNDDTLTKEIEIKGIYFNPLSSTYKTVDANVYGKNNNSVPIHVNIIAEYYDAEGLRIDKKSDTLFVYANTEFVGDVAVLDDTKYKTVKIKYQAEKVKTYETPINVENFEISSNIDSKKEVYYFINNKIDKKVYSFLSCLYYKNGKVVFAVGQGYVGLEGNERKQGRFFTSKLRLGTEYNSEILDFDEYKLFMSGAYNSNDTNY